MKFKKNGDNLVLIGVGKNKDIELVFFPDYNQFNLSVHRNDNLVVALLGTYLLLPDEDISVMYNERLKRIGIITGSHSQDIISEMERFDFSHRTIYLGNGDEYYSHWEIYYFEEDQINKSIVVGDETIELER